MSKTASASFHRLSRASGYTLTARQNGYMEFLPAHAEDAFPELEQARRARIEKETAEMLRAAFGKKPQKKRYTLVRASAAVEKQITNEVKKTARVEAARKRTISQIRRMVRDCIKAGLKDQVTRVFNKYNIPSVSQIRPRDMGVVYHAVHSILNPR